MIGGRQERAAQLQRAIASARFAVRTGDDYHVTIRVPQPDFAMPWRGIDQRAFDNVGIEFARPLNDDMPKGREVGVDQVRVIFLIPGVKLQDQPAGV